MTNQTEDQLLTPAEVAELWNRRALLMGFRTNYTRFSVTARRTRGKETFEPDVNKAHMMLYKESRARAIRLYPKESQRLSREEMIQTKLDLLNGHHESEQAEADLLAQVSPFFERNGYYLQCVDGVYSPVPFDIPGLPKRTAENEPVPSGKESEK